MKRKLVKIFDVSSYENSHSLMTAIESFANENFVLDIVDYETWITEIGGIDRELFIFIYEGNVDSKKTKKTGKKRMKIFDLSKFDTVKDLQNAINEIARDNDIITINFWDIKAQEYIKDVIIVVYEENESQTIQS
jgi:hypothetical protein